MRIARTIALCVLMCAEGCRTQPAKQAATGPVQRYQLHGQIIQLDSSHHIARIRHQKIEGWMEAMTMEFPVKDENEFQALHTGDQIAATVFVQDADFWIGEIHQELVK